MTRSAARAAPVDAPAARSEPRWSVRAPAPPRVVDELSARLNVAPWLAAVLHQRGTIDGEPEAALHAPLTRLELPGADAASARLSEALRRDERILVHGDYDADGITGAALLTMGLRAWGARAEAFLPNRLTHGYGLNPDLVADHADRCDLLVTVDCGITNVAEVAALRRAGVDVIVTDHHTPGEALPDTLVVHPSVAGTAYPAGAEPTGAGVAFHLLWAVQERLGGEAPLAYADLAMLGTVADVAPLLGVNRALVTEGLSRLTASAWPGLRAMLAQAHLHKDVTARDVAFTLAPRLNAAGRLGVPDDGLRLLTAATEREARPLAARLDERNEERRRIQDAMFDEALRRVDPAEPAIVVADDAWHPGVMGIVASKLLEAFHKPVFIIARGQGSVRSTPGLSAVDALRACAAHLRRYGGHRAAAGFAIDPDEIPAFRSTLHAWAEAHPAGPPEIVLDALVPAGRIDDDLWAGLQELEPYGEGHPAPRLGLCERLDAIRAVGRDGRHLQLRLAGIKGVAWNHGALAENLTPGGRVLASASVRENHWRDRRSLEFVADAVRTAGPLPLHEGGVSSEAARLAPVTRTHGGANARTWTRLPLDDDPLELHRPLTTALEDGRPLALTLDEAALAEVAAAAERYPTVDDVRRAFVAVRRGEAIAGDPVKARLTRAVLQELDLLDEDGRARSGARRRPFDAPTLRRGLLQRYRLDGFLSAYRHLDDDGFERAVHVLFGPDTVEACP